MIRLNMQKTPYRIGLPLLMMATMLTACHHDDKENSENRTFSITVTNLTANQPLSPLTAIACRSARPNTLNKLST